MQKTDTHLSPAKVSPCCQLEAPAACRTVSHRPGAAWALVPPAKRWVPEGGNRDLSTPRQLHTTFNSWSCETPNEPYWLHLPCETAVLPPEVHMESLSTPEPPPSQLCPGCSPGLPAPLCCGLPLHTPPSLKRSPQVLQHHVLSKVSKIRG